MTARHESHWSCSERGDALDLRSLRWDGEEVIERIYFALRDVWWRTVPMQTVEHRRTDTAEGFDVITEAVSESLPLRVSLRYRAAADAVRAEVVATALADFDYSRMGLCVLLSDEDYRGRSARSWGAGREVGFTFPVECITRNQDDAEALAFHRPFSALELSPATEGRYRLDFEGEPFELEDQRNWSDPSYKVYSVAPPDGPPVRARAGQTFEQRIVLQPTTRPATTPRAGTTRSHQAGRLELGEVIGVLPSIELFTGQESTRPIRPPAGFHELNAMYGGRTPSDDDGLRSSALPYDAVELGINGSVHADDDESVMATTRMHGRLATQARISCPGLPLVLAPVAFTAVAGDWRDQQGRFIPEPPLGQADGIDPRWATSFAATWVIASVAAIVEAQPQALRYLASTVPPDAPVRAVISRLSALEGRPVLRATAPYPLLALAIDVGHEVRLAVANTGPEARELLLPGGWTVRIAGLGSSWQDLPAAVSRS